MKKIELRKQVLAQLKAWSSEEKALADQRLLRRFVTSEAYHRAKTLATYLSLPHEWDTQPLIEQALADGKEVAVPKIIGKGEMVFVTYDPQQLAIGELGILSPTAGAVLAKETIDLLHVPGLVFSFDGYRIGYGGGFYDRYLADYTGMTISTVYANQLSHFTPEPHDKPVKELMIDDTPS